MVTNIESMLSKIKKEYVSSKSIPGMLPLGCLPGYVSSLHNTNLNDFDAQKWHVGLNNLARIHYNQLKLVLFQALPQHESLPDTSCILTITMFSCNFFETTAPMTPKTLFQEDVFNLTHEANEYIVGKFISRKNFV